MNENISLDEALIILEAEVNNMEKEEHGVAEKVAFEIYAKINVGLLRVDSLRQIAIFNNILRKMFLFGNPPSLISIDEMIKKYPELVATRNEYEEEMDKAYLRSNKPSNSTLGK